VRPLKLKVEGFTCYRRPVEVDFRDLDLFAIFGPTGAGKSSLVHAMTYALYGRVPGFGNEVKDLISQGSDHLQVTFEFAVDVQHYVVTRRTSRRGPPHVQLFRMGQDGKAEGLTDRARETEERVRALIGLDFEGFTRSVLLPQGQFHLFLAGEPKERRKVLAELLRLDIYDAIMRAANSEAARCEQDAANLRRRLQEDFADATPAALADRKRRLRELESRAQELAAAKAALEEGRAAAASLAGALEQLHSVRAELEEDQAALDQASAMAARGDEELHLLDADLRRVEGELAASPYQAELHQRLQSARTSAREHEQAEQRFQKLEEQLSAQQRALEGAEARRGAAEEAAARAQQRFQEAEARLEGLRRRHAAADLRRGLKPGDPCPVCNQPVVLPPPVEHVALAEAEDSYRRARAAADKAAREAEDCRQQAALAQQRLETLRQQRHEAWVATVRWRRELLSHLGLPQDVDRPPPRQEVQKDWQAQEEARQHHQSLQREQVELRRRREELTAAFEKARRELAGLEAKVQAQRLVLNRLEGEASRARERLADLARRQGWEDVSVALERGEEPVTLQQRAAKVEADLHSVREEVGAAKGEMQRIREGIEQAARLRQEESELTARGRLARELAGLLRADRFQAYVEEAALRVLAEDASRHLWDLSRERYQFDVQRQEFLVLDHWNGDEKRSVRTLSGGETFLASLALALALAERLPDLGATGAGTALESLFLDEGFSNLDTETRSMVADALERLHQDGTRMVGIITHDRELAERMPSRITVIKSESGSTLSAE